MPTYNYTARDSTGKIKNDMTEALNEQALVDKLQAQGFFIIKYSEVLQMIQEQTPQKSAEIHFNHTKVNLQDLLVFSRQLATMLEAGVALIRSLDVIVPQIQSKNLYNAVRQIRTDVEGGKSLSVSLSKHPKIFGQFWVSLVEVGEAAGTMPQVLNKLALHVEDEAALQSTVVSAVIYPAILCVVSIGAIIFFALVVAPKFEDIFTQMHAELPMITKMLLGTFKFIKQYIILIGAVVTVIIFILKNYFKTPRGKIQYEQIIFRIPIIGDITRTILMERFTSQMALLIGSGVPILLSLDIVERLVDNASFGLLIAKIRQEVREGKGLADSMIKENFFPSMAVQMIKVGEETGELAKMFNHVALFYKASVEAFMKRFGTIFEPFMLLFMAGAIGIIVVSIFMPLFKLGQSGGGH